MLDSYSERAVCGDVTMSAIYGMIDWNGNEVPEALAEKFHKKYESYRIDRMEEYKEKNLFMGCGIQYFTSEARAEKLPIYDRQNEILFTADCLLDNREQLLEELRDFNIATEASFDLQNAASIADGTLLYLMYLKYGVACAKRLRGAFSFVAYHKREQKAWLAADQFANRCLFYTVRENALYFSTLLFPMVEASGLHFEENERWLVDSISVRGPMMITEERETAYRGVYKVDCGHFIEISFENGRISTEYHCYYDPRKTIKINKKRSEEECGQLFLETFRKAVEACLRTDGEVAIELSSGLDSSAVAGVAAPMLANRGKKLYSYTSVPLKGSCEEDAERIPDETDGVKLICKMHPNIEPTFVDCAGKSILTEGEEILKTWEMPCKSQQNAVWIHEIFSKASGRCKIMLSGSTGNCTISMGSIHDSYFNGIVTGHLGSTYRFFVHYFNRYHARKRPYVKAFLRKVAGERIHGLLHRREDCYSDNLTRREIGEQYQLTKRFSKKICGAYSIRSFRAIRQEIYLRLAYAQIGEINTKHSLVYGVLERDPTRNVELIELLLSFPMRMFVNQDYDRRLVREFTEGIIPDSIRFNVRTRGLQGADNLYRIQKDWDRYAERMREEIVNEGVGRYLDLERITKLLDGLHEGPLTEQTDAVLLLMDVRMFALYLTLLQKK